MQQCLSQSAGGKNESLHSCLPLFPAGAIFPATLVAIKHDSRPPLLLYSYSDLLLKDHCNNYKLQKCYTQRRRDNFPGTQFFLDKLLFSKKGLGQGIPKQLVELKKVSEFFDGSLSPSENRPLGEKTLSSQMLLELNFFLMVSYI